MSVIMYLVLEHQHTWSNWAQQYPQVHKRSKIYHWLCSPVPRPPPFTFSIIHWGKNSVSACKMSAFPGNMPPDPLAQYILWALLLLFTLGPPNPLSGHSHRHCDWGKKNFDHCFSFLTAWPHHKVDLDHTFQIATLATLYQLFVTMTGVSWQRRRTCPTCRNSPSVQ